MPNNYGIIVCGSDRKDSAGSVGRSLLNSVTVNWKRIKIDKFGVATTDSVKSAIDCDGVFTGHFMVLAHGNYHPSQVKGRLYTDNTEITTAVVNQVNGILMPLGTAKQVYLHACGQGRAAILTWWQGMNGFNTASVWCPCITSMLAGSIDKADVKAKLGLP